MSRLETELGAKPPPGLLKAIGPEGAERLAAEIARARREEHAALEEASEGALKAVPRPLRGLVRKIAGG